MKANKYLTIHGHFYQPPRENPWTGQIEIQESAFPNHDWNDRIALQCYGPNASSRILSAYGKIEELINNYEYMSFNIGPTLMSWIRFNKPDLYQKIIDADKKSAERLEGHGNAIAQVYNHIIMPLADRRDRLTQIRWGIKDFEFHFGRKPESMWLAETAINNQTVKDLIDEGIRYVILSPTQAESYRKIGDTYWTGCANTDIEPRRPYRIYYYDAAGRKNEEIYLDVFFYDAGLSSAVGFEHLLRNADIFGNRINSCYRPDDDVQLVSIGTDGESYGHHEPYGDMCAAWLFTRYCPAHNIVPVNYGWFLEKFPPKHEVRLKNADGEGCAWSCAHGVGRWYRDCGCQTGAPEGWNQVWRTPLRDAVDFLKTKVDQIYEKSCRSFGVKDPWSLRDDYIHILLSPADQKNADLFLGRYLPDSPKHYPDLIELLEMQKYAMFSFTSCGWFFNDLTGLEPVQNLRYARRALEIMTSHMRTDRYEAQFLDILQKAQSNSSLFTGKDIYLNWVCPKHSAYLLLVLEQIFLDYMECPLPKGSDIRIEFARVKETLDQVLYSVELVNKMTRLEEHYTIILKRIHLGRIRFYVKAGNGIVDKISFPVNEKEFSEKEILGAADLFKDSLRLAALSVTEQTFENICHDFQVFPRRHGLPVDLLFADVHSLPPFIRVPLGISAASEIQKLALEALDDCTEATLAKARQLKQEADQWQVQLPVQNVERLFGSKIYELTGELSEQSPKALTQQICNLISFADLFGLDIGKTQIEESVYPLYLELKKKKQVKADQGLRNVLDWLNFAPTHP
jgi:hypothetical protein